MQSQPQLLEQMGVLAASHWGGNSVCPENQMLGGTGKSELGEGLNSSIWTRTAGHSACTWCLLLEGVTVSSPHLVSVCGGSECVFGSKLQAGIAGEWGGLRSGRGYEADKGLC